MLKVSPDINFIRKLQSATGSQIKTCMQCGACTASCELSADQEVFPRKQMIMAAWGMKEQLMADPAVWTCHQCGDCSSTCPRGVKPGEVLTALRQEQIIHYSKPRFLARWITQPAMLPFMVLFPAAVIILILSLAGTFRIPEGPVDYSAFFPHAWLNGSFTAFFLLSTIGIIISLRSFVRNSRSDREGTGGLTKFFTVLWRIMKHRDFNRCGEQKSRSLSHFLVFWGFILLLVVTFFAILSTIFWEYPLEILNPIKIAGNLGGIMLIAGSSLMILNRLIRKNGLESNYADWFFLVSFWLLAISGMLVEGARFHEWSFAYYLYFFHLLMVWIIILYYPYTKFAHFLYRTVAMVVSRTP